MGALPRGIVVGYDGSAEADAAALWAARTARLNGDPVVALVVMDPTDLPHGRNWPEPWWHEIEDRARETFTTGGLLGARVVRRAGRTTATLVEAARDASMLVVGSRGHGRVGEVLLGSVSQGAARDATCPVVVVRRTRRPGADRIVAGVDDTESSLRALDFACARAALTGEKVAVVRAWKPLTVPVDTHGDLPPELSATLLAEEQTLSRTVAAAGVRHPGVAIEADFIATGAGPALVDASGQASLVVVGTRGHHALGQAVLGSVSHHVLHRAHCTVAVVP